MTQLQDTNRFGPIIKDLRRTHQLTLRDMAAKTGLSSGFISKIERGLSNPSTSNLQKICYTLDITINDLIPPQAPTSQVTLPAPKKASPQQLVPKDQRSLIYNLNDMIKLESIFSENPSYKLDAMTLVGKDVEYMSCKHRYDEIGIVSKGKMAICFGTGVEYIMEEGDTLLIPSNTEHTVRTLSEDVCTSFWFKLGNSVHDEPIP